MTGARMLESKKICQTPKATRAVNKNIVAIDESLETLIRSAISAIRCGNYEIARNLLKTAVTKNIENPEIYNLFGISYEMEGDRLKASKFYRVSYYMDQTFAPASANLERVGQFWCEKSPNISWGVKENGDENK